MITALSMITIITFVVYNNNKLMPMSCLLRGYVTMLDMFREIKYGEFPDSHVRLWLCVDIVFLASLFTGSLFQTLFFLPLVWPEVSCCTSCLLFHRECVVSHFVILASCLAGSVLFRRECVDVHLVSCLTGSVLFFLLLLLAGSV